MVHSLYTAFVTITSVAKQSWVRPSWLLSLGLVCWPLWGMGRPAPESSNSLRSPGRPGGQPASRILDTGPARLDLIEPSWERAVATDSLVLLSSDTYCRGNNPILTVTGTNVRWYTDSLKKNLLARGNTYHSPPLDQTTTFYLTQTVGAIESVPQAISIEMVEVDFGGVTVTPARCGQNNGVISMTATGATARNPIFYSLNNGSLQRSPVFSNLAPGTYVLRDQIYLCYSLDTVVVPQLPAPTITHLMPVDPHCGLADGSVTIQATGGTGLLRYSLNGVDFTADNQFRALAGGDYQVSVRDEAQCTMSMPVSLRKTVALQLKQVDVLATSCGQPNGRISLQSTPGNGAITYSLDSSQVNTSGIFANLPAQTYTVAVRDETGCQASQSVAVGPSEGPRVNQIQALAPSCGVQDGRLTISASGASRLQYRLNGSPYQRDSLFDHLAVGSYTITVQDGQACTIEERVTLDPPCQEAVYLPDSFTPNQDGVNDGWAIFFSLPHVAAGGVDHF